MAGSTRIRSLLIGVLAAVSILAVVAISTVVAQISAAATTHQLPPSTSTTTVTATPAPAAPAPEQPTVTVTAQPPSPTPAPTTTPYTPPSSPDTPSMQQQPPIDDAPIYTDDDIRGEVIDAFNLTNQYWDNLFATWEGNQGEPIFWYTPTLYNGDGFYDSAHGQLGPWCGDEQPGPANASFCPVGYGIGNAGTISWDMEFFRPFADAGNDAVFYLTVAHEMGHAAQIRFIWDGEQEATLDQNTVTEETQADCIAGATLGKAERDGYLTMNDGDDEEIRNVMEAIGDYENDHGTPDQRYASYQRGYQSADIEECLGNK